MHRGFGWRIGIGIDNPGLLAGTGMKCAQAGAPQGPPGLERSGSIRVEPCRVRACEVADLVRTSR
jgi:hypothetical protein